MPYHNFCELVGEIYRINYDNDIVFPYDEYSQTDPRGCWQQYRRVEGKYIDFILENMFNVKPDYNYTLYSDEWSQGDGTYAYYEDGYYYSDAGDGGDGCGPDVIIEKVEILPDGKYQITVHCRLVTGGGDYELEIIDDIGRYNVVAEIKNIDGNSIWSFYKFTKLK